MASRFAHRSYEAEEMDDLEYGGPIMDQTLRELETINTLLGGNHVTINGLNRLVAKKNVSRLKIVDIGCGGGDMLKLVAQWARKKHLDVELIGVDANPHVIKFAKKNTSHYQEIAYQSINIFSEAFRKINADIFISTLFTHHFTEQELIVLFSQLKKQANIGFVINDIHRHWFAYHSIKWLTRLFSKSTMVQNDAAVSVSRSFLKKELQHILHHSQCTQFTLKWMWAFRWQIIVWL